MCPTKAARAWPSKGRADRRYEIIYRVTEDVKAALDGMLKPEEHEKELGRVLVKRSLPGHPRGHDSGLPGAVGCDPAQRPGAADRGSRVIGDYGSIRSSGKRTTPAKSRGIRVRHRLEDTTIQGGDMFEEYKIEEIARTL